MSLNSSQLEFVKSTAPFPAFVGGFGSGKTAAAIARMVALKIMFRKCDLAYYLPTYSLVEDVAFRRFPDLCERKGWAYKLNKTSSFIEFPDAGRIVFRTMENPARIVGYEVAHSICDELDTLPMDKAEEVWNKIIARNRQKCSMPNSVGVVTTPEGFRFTYRKWGKSPAPGYVLFRARTVDNIANLPSGYIENLRNTYPPNLLSAYLDGEFINLASGSVYPNFSRALNSTTATITPGEPVHVGMDFNVGKMFAAISVIRDGLPLTLAELSGVRDTPEMARILCERYVNNRHSITVYPDASGRATSSKSASESDLTILRRAGLSVSAPEANPSVKDRVNSVNAMILNDVGVRRWHINTDTCPVLAESLEQQSYDKNGEPDKHSGHDHPVDALGYFIVRRFPIVRRIAHVVPLRA